MYVVMLDTHIPIFEGTLFEMEINKINLLYWCKFYYQNVFSMSELDRPDDFTIDYDILLDTWLENKRFKESVKTPNSKFGSAMDMQDVITFD